MNEDSLTKLYTKLDVLEASDLKSLSQHLWRKYRFFGAILQVIREGIMVVNHKGEILYANEAACGILGITEFKQDKAVWKYVPEFVGLVDIITSPCENGHAFATKEFRVSYPKRAILSVMVTCPEKVVETDENVFVLRIVDVTAEREMNEQVLNRERVTSVMLLASSVAHEIGNPLNALSLRLQLMRKQIKAFLESFDARELFSSVDVCQEEIARLDGIVKNFLHAIRPQPLQFEDIDLGELITEVLEVMKAEFVSQNIMVRNGVPVLPIIRGDKNQLKQVFFNVLKNACEAISGEGMIEIAGVVSDNDASIVIRDSGMGMSQETFDHMFQPYFSTKSKGNGLGMMIVDRILREHGATLDISSAKGIGTQVLIHFPRKHKAVHLIQNKKNIDF